MDLKGADFQKRLVWRTNEGFNVQPFYRREDLKDLKAVDSLPGEFPFVRGNKKDNNLWFVRQDINAEDAKVYSIYVDGEDAYFQACRTVDGKYWIRDAGMNDNHVIIKTTEAKEIKVTMSPTPAPKYSVGFDDVNDATWETDLSDLQWAMNVVEHSSCFILPHTSTFEPKDLLKISKVDIAPLFGSLAP